MANRYTQFTPQQYVESFVETPTMDFPFQETMAITAYNQKREDDFMAKLGAASGRVQGGHITDKAGITESLNKDIATRFQDLAARFPNMSKSQATMELNRTATELQNDYRRKMVDADREYRDSVTKQMFTENYGQTSIHAGMTPDQIERYRSGELREITPASYNFITDPGKIPAFENPLSMIQPDIIKGYQLSEDGTHKITGGDQSLTMDVVMQRSKPFLESLRNDDGTIRISENMDPTMSKYINFKKAMAKQSGEDYLHSDFVRDYQDVATLKLKLNTSENVSGGSKGQGKKGGTEKEESLPFGNAPFSTTTYKSQAELTTPDDVLKDVNWDAKNFQIDGKDLYSHTTLGKDKLSPEEITKQEQDFFNERLQKRKDEIMWRAPVIIDGVEIPVDNTQLEIEAIKRAQQDVARRKIVSSAALSATATTGIDPRKITDRMTKSESDIVKNWKPVSEKPITDRFGNITFEKASNLAPKGYSIVKGQLVPDRLKSDLDSWNNAFGENINAEMNREWSTMGWTLRKEGDNLDGKSGLPEETRIIQTEVNDVVKRRINTQVSIGGKNFNFTEDEITDLGLKNENIEVDPHMVYRNNHNDKWYVTSSFVDSEGNRSKKTVDIDVTNSMSTILSNYPALKQHEFAQDLSMDNFRGIPKNTTSIVQGFTKEMEESFGPLRIKHNADNTYSFYGKMYNPKSGQIESFQDIKKSLGEGEEFITENLSRERAERRLTQLTLDRIRNWTDSKPSSNIVEPLGNLQERSYVNEIGAEAIIPLKSTMETIIGKESGGLGYDAMNQGSDNSFGDAPRNSGTATSILKRPLTEMTIAEVMKHQSFDKNDPNRIFAAGLFQITPSTMNSIMNDPSARERLGINPQMRYTPEVQEKLGIELIHRRLREAIRENGTPSYIYNTQGFYDKLFNKGYKTGDKEFGALTSEFRGLDKLSETEKKNVFNNILSYIEKNPNLNI